METRKREDHDDVAEHISRSQYSSRGTYSAAFLIVSKVSIILWQRITAIDHEIGKFTISVMIHSKAEELFSGHKGLQW
jgi:hypothetical protein